MYLKYTKKCRVCGSPHLKLVIDLGDQYLQGSFGKEGVSIPPLRPIPTQLVRCDVTMQEDACGLLQLAHTTPPEILYANYWYRSGTNATMMEHLADITKSAQSIVGGAAKTVLDIGCNDGTLLKSYPPDFEKFGHDPSDIAREIQGDVTLIPTVFPSAIGFDVIGDTKFDIVTSIAMYYDLEDPVGFAEGVKSVLAPRGIWVLEMSYLPLMLIRNSFDTICHEHLEYYSVAVLEDIAARAGLRIFKVSLNEINGGSIRCYLCHSDVDTFDNQKDEEFLKRVRIREFEMALDTDVPYQQFQKRIERLRDDMSAMLREIKAQGKTIHVYGASTKGNVLLQWCGIDRELVLYAADRNPEKHGAWTLGSNIQIISERESRAMSPDYYLVLPWHFRKEFLEREADTINNGTKMIFPLPEIRVVDRDNLAEEMAITKEGRELEGIELIEAALRRD